MHDGQLIYNKGAENKQWEESSLFNIYCWKNWITTCRRMELDPYFTQYTKINSKWIEDSNVRLKTVKLLEEEGESFMTLILPMI